jgi:23S rRNA (uracil1939-C5)-methyltransferase
MRVNELLTIPIADLELGGKAVARHDGRVVFVDRGLPGDEVVARVTRAKRTFAEARLERIERGSADREPAPCPHVERCGGCRFQELRYERQLEIKERLVRETLARIGGIEAPPVAAIVGAPERFHYRNKMEFSFQPDEAGAPVLGLHERGAFDRIFALETCLLPSPLTVEIVRLTQRFAREHRWRAYHPRRHEGVVRFLTVRHLPNTDECAVHLVAASDQIEALDAWAREVAAASPAVRTVTLMINDSRANIAVGEERALLGPGVIVERLLGLEFEVSGSAFLQTNSRQAEALYARALAAAALAGGESVLDLYCGAGTLTLLLARAAGEVVGVESVPESIERARMNAQRNAIANARFELGEARAVLREWARGERTRAPKPDVVVVDPPRAGLHARVVARVAELLPRRIVYVSCNPATLARDLKDFAARGYTLAEVAPFDLFPHTPHIECVALMTRAA